MNRPYKCAPLPFMGQKRYFLNDFTQILEMVSGEIDTVVDLFGGSGLLSHTAKRVLPECRVVYNDFDHYCRRLSAIVQTNEILRVIKDRLTGVEPNQQLTAAACRCAGNSRGLRAARWLRRCSDNRPQCTVLRKMGHLYGRSAQTFDVQPCKTGRV